MNLEEELNDRIQELEGDIYELKSSLKYKNIELDKCKLLIHDILYSSNDVLKNDDNTDYKSNIENLYKYIKQYLADNYIKL